MYNKILSLDFKKKIDVQKGIKDLETGNDHPFIWRVLLTRIIRMSSPALCPTGMAESNPNSEQNVTDQSELIRGLLFCAMG